MRNEGLYQLFIDGIEDMYSAEQQIVEALPKLIGLASNPDLKKALSNHLQETEEQVTRLEEIFRLLNREAQEKTCRAIEGLIEEADEIVQNKSKSAVLDAGIIYAAQKVEHYEIASYGTLRSFAEHLNLDSEVSDLIQASLDEEGAANKSLTKIADGSLFTSGVNKKAAEARR